MKLQKGKWYVCIKSWKLDCITFFYEGDIVQCEKDDEMKDWSGRSHLFIDDEPERIFREATEAESRIVSATEVNMDEFMEGIDYFHKSLTMLDIYRNGAEAMLRHIKANLKIVR